MASTDKGAEMLETIGYADDSICSYSTNVTFGIFRINHRTRCWGRVFVYVRGDQQQAIRVGGRRSAAGCPFLTRRQEIWRSFGPPKGMLKACDFFQA